ncbi:hypothetical protein SK069_14060, partial [Patulibacter brassicae]
MDRRVRSYLDHAGRELAAGRHELAAGLEREAQRAAERLHDGRAERLAVLRLRVRRLRAERDHAGAIAALVAARELTDDPAAAFDLRTEEVQLRVAAGEPDATAAAEALVAEGRTEDRARWARARALAVLAQAREASGDAAGARRATDEGRELLTGGPPPPAELAA